MLVIFMAISLIFKISSDSFGIGIMYGASIMASYKISKKFALENKRFFNKDELKIVVLYSSLVATMIHWKN